MSDCIFCRIAGGEMPARSGYDDPEMRASHDVNPQAPVHLLLIPAGTFRRCSRPAPKTKPCSGAWSSKPATSPASSVSRAADSA